MGEIRVAISDVSHKKLKQMALDRGITLKQLLVNIFEECIEQDRQQKSAAGKGEKKVIS